MPHSKRKGKTGELEAAQVLRDLGIPAGRSQQFAGSVNSADLLTDLGHAHVEVKFQAKPAIEKAWQQAEGDRAEDDYSLVLTRKVATTERGLPWLLTIRLESLPALYADLKHLWE